MHRQRNKPMARDNLFRIYSMTKPLTSIAVMQLYEQAHFQLDDAVEQYIPEFKGIQVYNAGNADHYSTIAPTRPMTVRHLLTHTAGLTYGFHNSHVVDQLYRRADVDNRYNGNTLADKIKLVATMPLQFCPGDRWNYSIATDVLGYLVETLSGKTLDVYIKQHITAPLGMVDTTFSVAPENIERFAACYARDPQTGAMVLADDPVTSRYNQPPTICSGGSGMVASIDDYHTFALALLGKGSFQGNRIIGSKTFEYMTQNHLPDNRDLNQMAQSLFSETTFDGIGFGLGFAVLLDPVKSGMPGSIGEFGWGGAASTYFWVDPLQQLCVIFMTQLMPSNAYPLRRQLKTAVYQALVD